MLIKEQFIAQGDARIGVSDVSGKKKEDMFGTPVENTVAMKLVLIINNNILGKFTRGHLIPN